MISFIKYNGNFKGKLSQINETWDVSCGSKLNNSSKVPLKLSDNLLDAMFMFAGTNIGRRFFVGKAGSQLVVELENTDGTTQVLKVRQDVTGEIIMQAAIASGDANKPALDPNYFIADKYTKGYSGTAGLLAIMNLAIKEPEAEEAWVNLNPYLAHDPEDDIWDDPQELDAFARFAILFQDNVYRRIKDAVSLGKIGLKMPQENKEFKMLHAKDLTVKVKAICGTPLYYTNVDGGITQNAKASGKFDVSQYRLNDLDEYDEEAKSLIPTLIEDGTMSANDWEIETAQYIKLSSKYREPIRTCYFVGPAGCGKTTGCDKIAELLGLPRMYHTCDPDMDLFKLMGELYPVTDSKATKKVTPKDVCDMYDLPTTEDIEFNIESSYIRMYGKEYDGTSKSDLLNALMGMVFERMAELNKGSDYVFVEGPLIKALRIGALLELQEMGVVRRPGVAVALNAILESGKNKYINLPTGERVYKNKNTVIIFTSNDEYEGTVNLNQSVLSRMGHVVWFEHASIDEMASRTKNLVSDFKDDARLREMAKIISDINVFCRENGITSGVCGQRELNSWAMETMIRLEIEGEEDITDDILRRTCQTAVLNKVSQNADDVIDVANGIVNPILGECDMKVSY